MTKSKTIIYIIIFIVSTPLIIRLSCIPFLTPEIVELRKTSSKTFHDFSNEVQTQTKTDKHQNLIHTPQSNISNFHSIRQSKPLEALLDDARDRAKNPLLYEGTEMLMDCADKNYELLSNEDKALFKGLKLLDHHSAKELNAMSDEELIRLMQE